MMRRGGVHVSTYRIACGCHCRWCFLCERVVRWTRSRSSNATADAGSPGRGSCESWPVSVGLFPPQYVKDATTGELKGVWAETARALAKRIGVQVVISEHPTPVKAAECLKAGLCDAVILALAPRSAEAGDLSKPFMQFDFTFLVPVDSQVRSITDLDRPGARIAAVRHHLTTLALSKLLKHAELVYGKSPDFRKFRFRSAARRKGRCLCVYSPSTYGLFGSAPWFTGAGDILRGEPPVRCSSKGKRRAASLRQRISR